MGKKKLSQPILLATKQPSVGTVNIKQFNYDRKIFLKLYQYLYGKVLKDYSFRMSHIAFRFDDKTVVKTRVRTALINLIFWIPYIHAGEKITPDTLFDTTTISEKTIAEKLDSLIMKFKSKLTIQQLCKYIRHCVESLATISMNFCVVQGNTIDIRDIIDLANSNKRFDELIHTEYSDNLPMSFIEKDIMDKTYETASIIKASPDCSIRPFLMAGGNVNMGQMSQCLISIGPRSDIYGNIAPVIVNTNFIRGLRNASDYYLESYSCRKALIANRYSMSDSGYTSRQMDLLGIDATLVDIEDCGSSHTIDLTVTDEKVLKMLRYKYYVSKVSKDGTRTFKEIVPERDAKLIGKTIQVRSHIHCNLPEGQYCKKCYGELAYFNLGYNTNLLAMHSLSEPIGQMVLSTKHLNKTKTRAIEWPENISQYFKCETDAVYINEELCVPGIELAIYAEDIEDYLSMFEQTADNDATETDTMLYDYVTKFELVIHGEPILFDVPDIELYLDYEFLTKLLKSTKTDDGKIYVNLANYSSDQPVFTLNIENIEISQYLNRFMKLIGIKRKSTYTTIEDLLQPLIAVICELDLDLNFAHVESLVYNMIRSPDMIIHRPATRTEPYTIVPASTAILYSRCLSTSLSFERIGAQLRNPMTYIKNDKGVLDAFFR
jgi:hypothetical protein